MDKENGKGNNQYGLRNRECMNRVAEEEENKEEEEQEEEDKEEDNEGEGGRDCQRRHVDEVYYNKNSEENHLDNDDLEEPAEFNFENNAGAAADNNQGRGEGNVAWAPQSPAAAASNQGRGEGGRAGAPQGPAAVASNQGHGEGGRAGAPQGPAGATNNQGHRGGGCAGAPQGPAGAAGVAVAVNPINCMEMPFCQYVDNCVQAYKSPVNDLTREIAMRSAEAHVISLQHLVDNSNEERQKG
jgi:hypothetical protein